VQTPAPRDVSAGCDGSSASAAREWCSVVFGAEWTPEAANFLGCEYNFATGECAGTIYAPRAYFSTSEEVAFALCAVRSVAGDFFVSSHPAATIHCLDEVGGDFRWRLNQHKTLFPPTDDTLALPQLRRIGGGLVLSKNGPGLEVLSVPKLEVVSDKVQLSKNDALRGVEINYGAPPTLLGGVTISGKDVFCASSSRTLQKAARASGSKFKTDNAVDPNC